MKKKLVLILIMLFLAIGNVNAKKITKATLNKTYAKYKNPKTGVIHLEYTIVPIVLFGGCLIVHNISQNKEQKNKKIKHKR